MQTLKFRLPLFLSFALFIFLFPSIVSAQEKIMGEITLTGENGAENFVTVNGERVSSGRTIMSPADISTSANSSARIALPKTGTIVIAPNSKMKLYFVSGEISGNMSAGEATFNTETGTSLDIQTSDGKAKLLNKDQPNIVKITVNDGETKIYTLVGATVFNKVTINAGEYYPVQTDDTATTSKTSGSNTNLIIFALIGAAAAAVVLGLASRSGGDSSPASPVR